MSAIEEEPPMVELKQVNSPVNTRNTSSKLKSPLPLSPGARSDPTSRDDRYEPPTPIRVTHSVVSEVPLDEEGERPDLEEVLEEKPEEPQAAADSTAGSGDPLGSCNPEYLRQFEQLFGQRVFGPNVSGSSLGVTGPDE
jgi:hypothetical protein